ncbi:DNA-directed RNA polymerase III subunit 1, partial [Cucurbita argyrosperma subsp. sororia]
MNKAQVEGLVFSKQPYIEDVGPHKMEVSFGLTSKSMQFSTFSRSEISKMAEVQVYKGLYYDTARKPINGGLLDAAGSSNGMILILLGGLMV